VTNEIELKKESFDEEIIIEFSKLHLKHKFIEIIE